MTELPRLPVFEPPPTPIPSSFILRRLPWQSPEGRLSMLVPAGGYLSRLADDVEAQQLASARAVWDLALIVLDNPAAGREEVRFAARRLRESLGDVLQLLGSRDHFHEVPIGSATSPYARRWTYDPRCVGQARRDLHRVLCHWKLTDIAERAELVLSELVTNALKHAEAPPDGEIETRYERLPAGIRIEVHDVDAVRPLPQHPAPDTEAGRGLALVDALTGAQWGVSEREGPGKCVWAIVEADSDAGEEAR